MKDIDRFKALQTESVRSCMEKLNRALHQLFVVDEADALVGCVSDGDIRRWILKGNGLDVPVREVMNPQPKFVRKGEEQRAKALIEEYVILAVPVVDEAMHILDIVFWNEEGKTVRFVPIETPVFILTGGK